MSYILEALKKAQAERQLGNAPTIHAPQPVQAAEPGAAASRKPLFIGLGAGALVVAAGAMFMWQRGATPAPVPASLPGPTSAAAPAVAGRELAAVPPAPASAAAGAASNTLEVSAPPEPVAPPRPAHAAEPRVAEAPARPAPSAAGRAGTEVRASASVAAPVAAPASAPAVAPALPAVRTAPVAAAPRAAATPAPASVPAPAPEDSLPYLHQLPDTIQRDIPRVSFGGYMYSANPADRLLLVDKALRHEGEEVGPGLVLEKLLPKAAVMNYRGVRYRVAY
jgi:general secretion pathway protein B